MPEESQKVDPEARIRLNDPLHRFNGLLVSHATECLEDCHSSCTKLAHRDPCACQNLLTAATR